jgi:hypothetical protein
MFYNKRGFPLYPGKSVKEWDWKVGTDTALPSWLVQPTAGNFAGSTLTLNTLATGTGFNTVATVATAATSASQAGIATAQNINWSGLQEVTFGCYSFYCNESGSTVTDQAIAITHFDSAHTAGLWLQNNTGASGNPPYAGEFDIHIYGSPVTAVPFPYSLDDINTGLVAQKNWHKQKDIFITVRPVTKEVFVHAGDPYKGGGCIYYAKGVWTNPVTLQPFQLAITTNSAAVRTLAFGGFFLRTIY